MILNTQELREVTDKILMAVDTSEISTITETLQLEMEGETLILSVTNKEYYATVKIYVGYNEPFYATVNANLFLKLIAQTTSEDIELTCTDQYLLIKGNGSYKLPLIYDGDELLSLDKIDIKNSTCNMDIPSTVLQSILKYNSKELTKGVISRPVQKYYYLDENGCLTFTTGACVNKFTLSQPVKILLNNKLVKLFKLFTDDSVKFTLGYDALAGSNIIQAKVRFEDNKISLTAILNCDDAMLNSVPVNTIRGRADAIYPYSITIDKNLLMQAINRLTLFNKGIKTVSSNVANFTFNSTDVIITDSRGENSETINYLNSDNALEDKPYEAKLDLNDVKLTLGACDESTLTIKFGTGGAFVIARTNILNIIPQCI